MSTATITIPAGKCACPKCEGQGRIRAFRDYAAGVCFMCHGTGLCDIKEYRSRLDADALRKARWVLAAKAESFAGWAHDRLNAVREFCHSGDGVQQAFPGLLSHWQEVGESIFQDAQGVLLAQLRADGKIF